MELHPANPVTPVTPAATYAPGTTNAMLSSTATFSNIYNLSGADGVWSTAEIQELTRRAEELTTEITDALRPKEETMSLEALLKQQIEDARNPLAALMREIQELKELAFKADAAMEQMDKLNINDTNFVAAKNGLRDAIDDLKGRIAELTRQLEALMTETARPQEFRAA